MTAKRSKKQKAPRCHPGGENKAGWPANPVTAINPDCTLLTPSESREKKSAGDGPRTRTTIAVTGLTGRRVCQFRHPCTLPLPRPVYDGSRLGLWPHGAANRRIRSRSLRLLDSGDWVESRGAGVAEAFGDSSTGTIETNEVER